MALIECPECNKEVSDLAASCPHCGCPLGKPAEPEAPPEDEEERTLFVANPVIFRGKPTYTFIAVVLAGLAIYTLFDLWGGEWAKKELARTTAWVVLGISALYMVWRWIQCASAQLRITTERTVVRHGFISRKVTEVRHDDVKMVHTEQNLLQRILRVGHLGVGSAGHSTDSLPEDRRVGLGIAQTLIDLRVHVDKEKSTREGVDTGLCRQDG